MTEPCRKARSALDFALEEAWSARVAVVTALQPPEYWPLTSSIAHGPSRHQLERLAEAAEQATREMVAAAVRDSGSAAVAVSVDVRVVQGNPAKVLIDQSAGTDLLVVGHRGRGPLASACLGSVSLQCVLYANCPVVVVRQTATATADDGQFAGSGATSPT